MAKYLSIGKVAKLKNVSIKSLRYYDEIGVFVPAYINAGTNYRYYTEEQLPMLDAITTCIELGMPLKNLSSYLKDGQLSVSELINDCQKLADAKISLIQKSMLNLKNMHAFEPSCEQPSEQLSSSVNSISTQKEPITSHRFIDKRTVLAIPYEQDAKLNALILRLLTLAQLIGIEASYPSGIIHCYDHNSYERYVYITVSGEHDSFDKRIITLPADDYYVKGLQEHLPYAPSSEVLPIQPGNRFMIIEADVLSEKNDNVNTNGMPYEMQLTTLKIEQQG